MVKGCYGSANCYEQTAELLDGDTQNSSERLVAQTRRV